MYEPMGSSSGFSKDQLFEAAILLAGRKSRDASRELSRQTDKSYILVGREGDIIARLKLPEVHKKCRCDETLSSGSRQPFRMQIIPVNGKVMVGTLLGASVVVMLLWLASYYLREEQLKDELSRNKVSFSEIKKATDDFSRFQQIAQSTPRISLSSPVTKLQELQRVTQEIQVSPCLSGSLKTVADGQTKVIDGLVYFMDSDNSEAIAASMLSGGSVEMAAGLDSAKRCLSLDYLRSSRKP